MCLLIGSANTLQALPYKWKQTLQDVDVTVPVPKGTRGKDVDVIIKKNHLTVGLKGKEPIIKVCILSNKAL